MPLPDDIYFGNFRGSSFKADADPNSTPLESGLPITTEGFIEPGSVDTDQIVAGAITNTEIADDSISTPKLKANVVTAEKVLAGAITADKLAATLLLASLIKTADTGSRIEMDTAGFRAYDSSNVLLINVPTNDDPIYVHANITTERLLNTQEMIIDNYDYEGAVELKPGSWMYVWGPSGYEPSEQPFAMAWWEDNFDNVSGTSSPGIFEMPALASWVVGGGYYDAAGGADGATACYVAVVRDLTGNATWVYEWKLSDGTIDRTTLLSTHLASAGYMTRIGASWYFCYGNAASTKTYMAKAVRATGVVSLAGTDVTSRFVSNYTVGWPVKTDGTSLWVAGSSTVVTTYRYRLVKFNTSLAYVSTTELAEPAIPAPATQRDPFLSRFEIKPSATKAWVGITYYATTWVTARVYEFDLTTGAVTASTDMLICNQFESENLGMALTWDGTNFYEWIASGGNPRWTRFSNWSGSIADPYWVCYSYYDSAGTTHESPISTRKPVDMDRGQSLHLGGNWLPGIGDPDDPNNFRYYVKPGAADPGAGNFKLQATTPDTVRWLTDYNAGGAADSAGTPFPSIEAAAIVGDTWYLYGDEALFETITMFSDGVIEWGGRSNHHAVSGPSFQTTTSGAGDSGKWTKVASGTISGQYGEQNGTVLFTGWGTGAEANWCSATLRYRLKQQAAFGNDPYVTVDVSETRGSVDPSDFAVVVTDNDPVTTWELWVRLPTTYLYWSGFVLLDTGVSAPTYYTSSGVSASYSAGTAYVGRPMHRAEDLYIAKPGPVLTLDSTAADQYAAILFRDNAAARWLIDYANSSSDDLRFGSYTGAAGSESFTSRLLLAYSTGRMTLFGDGFAMGGETVGAALSVGIDATSGIVVKNDTAYYLRGFQNDTDTQPMVILNRDGTITWGPGGSGAVDVNLYRGAANVLKTSDQFVALGGLQTLCVAGAVGDANFAADADGNFGVDTTNHRWYYREGGGWHYINRTAGFQIPIDVDGIDERVCVNCGVEMLPGQKVIGQLDGHMSDGALHGVYVHQRCPGRVRRFLTSVARKIK